MNVPCEIKLPEIITEIQLKEKYSAQDYTNIISSKFILNLHACYS